MEEGERILLRIHYDSSHTFEITLNEDTFLTYEVDSGVSAMSLDRLAVLGAWEADFVGLIKNGESPIQKMYGYF